MSYNGQKQLPQDSRFKEGETLNVWASSGLNMREKPDAKSAKRVAIPYGAEVSVLPNIGVKMPFEVEEFKGFTVKGYWLLVKYGNTEGFVFDGFLSRLPAPVPTEMDLAIETYLETQIKRIGQEYDIQVYDDQTQKMRPVKPNEKYQDQQSYQYKVKYNFNLRYERKEEPGGRTITFILPNLTLFEGYLLVKEHFYDAEKDVFSFDKKGKTIIMKPKKEGEGCTYWIKQDGNKITITDFCGD